MSKDKHYQALAQDYQRLQHEVELLRHENEILKMELRRWELEKTAQGNIIQQEIAKANYQLQEYSQQIVQLKEELRRFKGE